LDTNIIKINSLINEFIKELSEEKCIKCINGYYVYFKDKLSFEIFPYGAESIVIYADYTVGHEKREVLEGEWIIDVDKDKIVKQCKFLLDNNYEKIQELHQNIIKLKKDKK